VREFAVNSCHAAFCGHWKLVLTLLSAAGLISTWQHHAIDYGRYPPMVIVGGAARDTLDAAYAVYTHVDSGIPFLEQGFCARTWATYRVGWNTTIVRINKVVRSERDASPIRVIVPCGQSSAAGAGIIFHTHPPQRCVVKGRWESWSDCAPSADGTSDCRPSWLDLADTLDHGGVPARLIVCGEDRFVLYHATGAL
jgi:hypothetical protein